MRGLALYFAATLGKALTFATGLVAIPLALLFKGKPRWLWRLWENPEDGWDVPPWYDGSKYTYHCWRNPGAGMRNWRWYAPWPVPADTYFNWKSTIRGAHKPPTMDGKWYWFHAWMRDYHGWYATRYIRTPWGPRWLDIRIGWKVDPKDSERIAPAKARWGVGFTALSISAHK